VDVIIKKCKDCGLKYRGFGLPAEKKARPEKKTQQTDSSLVVVWRLYGATKDAVVTLTAGAAVLSLLEGARGRGGPRRQEVRGLRPQGAEHRAAVGGDEKAVVPRLRAGGGAAEEKVDGGGGGSHSSLNTAHSTPY
jgi:hypothetical protein